MVGGMANAQLVALCIDALRPAPLARFWAAALGWDVDETGDEVQLVPTDGTTFRIACPPTTRAKSGQSRIHLDLTTTSLDHHAASVDQLLALGASHLDIGQRPDEPHIVLADPEGNELCIIEPQNSFLAGCGRLGSITCDGSRAVGCFWSAALGWPLVWDQDEETAIRAPDGTGPFITWGGPPHLPKHGPNRLHLELATPDGYDREAEVDRLVALGATLLGPGHAGDSVMLADPDGNELCLR